MKWQVFLLLLALFSQKIFCTPVALLQESGVFQGDTYMIRKDVDLTRGLKDFTICAWISLNFLRGTNNFWLNVASNQNDKILVGTFENGVEGPRIRMTKYHPKIKDEVSIILKRFDFQTFHHYCFSFTSQAQFPYPGGYVNLTNKAYVDGNLVNEEMKTIIKSNYEEIPRYVDVIIGQRYTRNQRSLLPEESFSGRFAEVTIYKNGLTLNAIRSLASCKEVDFSRDLILDWFISSYDLIGDIVIEDKASQSLCEASPFSNVAIFNHGTEHDYVKFICDKLGGQLPTFGTNQTDRDLIYQDLKSVYEENVSKVTCSVSEDMNTDKGRDVTLSTVLNVVENSKSDVFFWTGIIEDVDAEKEVFLNEYTNEPISWDPNIYPGPVGDFQCTMARGKHLVKKDCMDQDPCGICQLNEPQKRLRLKGLCADDLIRDSDFDTEFYAHGLFNDRLYFRGIRASHIFVDPVDDKWTIQSLKNPGKISKLNYEFSKMRYPIGRLTWTVQNNETQYGICGLENGQSHDLTLSDCFPDKFSCNNGQCIELQRKCDGVIDCQDGTDELECEFLLLDQNYSKDKLPLVKKDEPVQVFFSVSITAYPKIDTANSKITTDYDLSMKWYDPRLIFRDLKADETFNGLNSGDKQIIWSPTVDAPNALGTFQRQLNDDSTKVVLLRETEETLPEDFSQSKEARLFSGQRNAVLLTKKFSQDHACNFNLFYYPFDTQVCTLKFELRDKTEDFVTFKKEGEGINYVGDRNLADYEILFEDLEITKSASNHSLAVAMVVFRRQTGFHAITTFAQTLAILLVAFVTFFFNIRNFSDRVMVNLILLLVLSTLSSSAQSGVPKTSYYKMIDIWFLFLLIIIVLVIIGHTIITIILGSESAENKVFGNRRLFNRRNHSAGAVSNGSAEDGLEDDNEELGNAKTANLACMGAFVAILVLFNIIFWVYALQEHGSPIENLRLTVQDE